MFCTKKTKKMYNLSYPQQNKQMNKKLFFYFDMCAAQNTDYF